MRHTTRELRRRHQPFLLPPPAPRPCLPQPPGSRTPSRYKRIAGYFRSSIFELVGEEIAGIPKVQIVCNSELDAADVAVSKHARETALKERWNEAPPEVEALLHRDRYRRLHELLTSGRVEIRVVPKDRVFIHGKAGVIETGRRIEDLLPRLDQRDQERLRGELRDSLGGHLRRKASSGSRRSSTRSGRTSYPLPDAIIEEIKRVADRVEIRFEDATHQQSFPAPRWPRAPSTAAENSFNRGSAHS